MSMLLFIVGGIAVMAGAATIAFGVPINEFSFGNTLIVSGTLLGVGGLIIIAIAVAVRELHRVAQALAAHPAAAPPYEALEPPPRAAAPSRLPFPPRTRPAAVPEMPEPPLPAEPAVTETHSFAPSLPNPEAPPPSLEEEVSLSPNGGGFESQPSALAPPARPAPPHAPEPAFEAPKRPAPPHTAEPAFEAPKRPAPPPSANFDAMWPAKPAEREEPAPEAEAKPEPAAAEPAAEKPLRAVAILKSGVVDGMGYTLYVDGSIEAELPQGTLRFASIDELRAHLEKGGS